MAKINPCFKKIFVFFNLLFAIFGGVILGLGLLAYLVTDIEERSGGIILAVIGAVIFVLSVLGAYGAHKENKNVLIAFFVCMCMGTIALLRIAIPLAQARPEFMATFEEHLRAFVPLDRADPHLQRGIDIFQNQFKCCGLFNGYQDWRNNIPDSCNCLTTKDVTAECQEVQDFTRQLWGVSENKVVYSKPCGPIILDYVQVVFKITLGLFFGLAALALLASVMSITMIIQITAIPNSSPPIFALSAPPKYSELDKSDY